MLDKLMRMKRDCNDAQSVIQHDQQQQQQQHEFMMQ